MLPVTEYSRPGSKIWQFDLWELDLQFNYHVFLRRIFSFTATYFHIIRIL